MTEISEEKQVFAGGARHRLPPSVGGSWTKIESSEFFIFFLFRASRRVENRIPLIPKRFFFRILRGLHDPGNVNRFLLRLCKKGHWYWPPILPKWISQRRGQIDQTAPQGGLDYQSKSLQSRRNHGFRSSLIDRKAKGAVFGTPATLLPSFQGADGVKGWDAVEREMRINGMIERVPGTKQQDKR